MKNKKPFDKYLLYRNSVQCPEDDIKFFTKVFKSLNKKPARTFREDFSGTFSISLEWIRAHAKNKSIAVDIDSEPLDYGKKHYLPKMTENQQKRIKIIKKSVLSPTLPKADIISVTNFSYYTFKERKALVQYFKNARKKLFTKGLFIIDAFGGSECQESSTETVKRKNFTYYWEQEDFDPINNYALFYIHFKRKNEKKRRKVFSYDWRFWSLPEIQDALKDAGFKDVQVYWEQSTKSGSGSGVFKKASSGESCACWIAYIISRK